MEAEESIPEDQDMIKPQRSVENPTQKRRPTWAQEAIKDAERYGAHDGSSRKVKKPKLYPGYVELLCDIIDGDPTNYEEVAGKKEWKDAMVKEYQSIVKNDVWDVVPVAAVKFTCSSESNSPGGWLRP